MTPCTPTLHRTYRGILGHVRHHAARSTDCNPHVGTGIAKALKAAAIAAGIGAGAIGAGAGAAAAAGAWWPVAWQPGGGGDVWHGEPIGDGAGGAGVPSWAGAGDGSVQCPPGAEPVAEPGGALVLAVGLAGLVWVRRRR